MREIVRRCSKRLLWCVIAVALAYGSAKTADFFWFRAVTPAQFRNANWAGSWHTNQYGLTGRLLVQLPDPLPDKKEFKAEALVYYPVYSVWKTGQFVKMDFTGYFTPRESTSSGKSTVPRGEKGGELKFKGEAGDQTVDYVALITPEHSLIIGGYLSQFPNDYGSFQIDAR